MRGERIQSNYKESVDTTFLLRKRVGIGGRKRGPKGEGKINLRHHHKGGWGSLSAGEYSFFKRPLGGRKRGNFRKGGSLSFGKTTTTRGGGGENPKLEKLQRYGEKKEKVSGKKGSHRCIARSSTGDGMTAFQIKKGEGSKKLRKREGGKTSCWGKKKGKMPFAASHGETEGFQRHEDIPLNFGRGTLVNGKRRGRALTEGKGKRLYQRR